MINALLEKRVSVKKVKISDIVHGLISSPWTITILARLRVEGDNDMADYKKWLDKIEKWNISLEHEDLSKDDRWLLSSISKLTTMAVECDQSYIPTDGYLECARVIRLRKPIPNYLFSALNMEKVLMSGIYVKHDGIILTKKWIEDNGFIDKRGTFVGDLGRIFPDYSVPSLREIGGGNYFMLKKGGLSDILEYGRHYYLFSLEDDASFG